MVDPDASDWQIACLAARVLAVGRHAIGGLHLRARSGPVRDAWIEYFQALLPPDTAWRRITPTVPLGRLIGGLDVTRTLEAGRPQLEQGVLGAVNGGVLVVSMAERSAADFAATIGAAMDDGAVRIERSGLSRTQPTRFCALCLDEGADEDEKLPASLSDRLALTIDLSQISWHETRGNENHVLPVENIDWKRVTLPPETGDAIEAALLSVSHGSMRTSLWMTRVCRIIAALDGATNVEPDHAALAFQIVHPLGAAPQPEEQPNDPRQSEAPNEQADLMQDDPARQDGESGAGQEQETPPGELLVATQEGVLPDLADGGRAAARQIARHARQSGKSGVQINSGRRGRPVGISSVPPYPGARLNVPATLVAAAPWQVIRRRERAQNGRAQGPPIELRKSDFRYVRLRDRTETTAILGVDASGSTAMERLGEAKGATELLLAECYVRRERVAMIAFKGRDSEIVLAPTRSLVRAKKCLTALTGGGGTPMASGMEKALQLALVTARHGQKPLVVLLTDGSANIALDGRADRQAAWHDAEMLAVQFPAHGIPAIVIDIARRSRDTTRSLAQKMDAHYYVLPRADARSVSTVVSDHMRAL